jgi:hypothetical protein
VAIVNAKEMKPIIVDAKLTGARDDSVDIATPILELKWRKQRARLSMFGSPS